MRPPLVTCARTIVLGMAAAVGLAGCSAAVDSDKGMSSPSPSRTLTSPVAQPRASAIPQASASPSSITTKQPEFSPQSIRITKKAKRGRDLVLTVVAPQDTRFAIGKDYSGVSCTATILESGSPTTYRVDCPSAPADSQLVATISYGDWDYGFMKAL